MDFIAGLLMNFLMGFLNLVMLPWHVYTWIRLETLKEKMNVLLLMGMSQQFFFMMVALVVSLVVIGMVNRTFLRRTVRGLELFNGTMGKIAAWFALLMMLQQVLIIAMGQIFRGNDLFFAPLGVILVGEELQWLSGQLKFYNAMLIAVASAYTFIEGGHVRVDLVYSVVNQKTKRWIDLIGTLVLLFPSTILLWWFAWPIAMNSMFAQRPMNIWSTTARWRGVRLEESGTAEFSWVWSFKVLILVFAALMFVTAVAFLLRNILALIERDQEVPTHYSLDGTDDEPQSHAAAQ